MRDQFPHSYKKHEKLQLCIPWYLYFWIANWKTNHSWQNDNKRSLISVSLLMFRTVVRFHCEELLAPRPTIKLEDQPLLAVRDYLVNIFAATLHIWRPFLHTQPKHATSFGDGDPLIMGQECKELEYWIKKSVLKHLTFKITVKRT